MIIGGSTIPNQMGPRGCELLLIYILGPRSSRLIQVINTTAGNGSGKNIIIRLKALTAINESDYESSVPIFEEFVKTVKFTK